jgi:hypothetical protein
MENKQTAVEWVEDELSNLNTLISNTRMTFEEYHKIRISIWEKAKQMEKEQIFNAYNHNMTGFDKLEQEEIGLNWSEDYYKATYKSGH